ncbi:hypothetical protein [Cytobacillus gottheilii]|uniref:Uncharacterized protein n=1 Tax=Cytobacillus gottheilii TaxID=859144 RepID=A0ABX8F910_9BACI|nr:hypothetical protein [Cytobacillus gottheilii]QVY60921.1 hypothetical protein J1899_18400 [Cytobacillus gottheilii]
MLKVQYTNEDERTDILEQHADMFFIEEQNLISGNFLIFSDNPLPEKVVYKEVPEIEFNKLKDENTLLKAQNSSLSERADFIEDVIAEMAMNVYR